jgi:catechol 2,3-dioxygenase-like lactoylglutathione lyase family enzyme
MPLSPGRLPVGGFAPLVPELDVIDLEASLRFWCGVLGFAVVYDRPERGFAYLEWPLATPSQGVSACESVGQRIPVSSACKAQIMLCRRNGKWKTAVAERPFGRGINFQFNVERVSLLLHRLSGAEWKLFRPVEENWYRAGDAEIGCREFLVQYPDGYLLRFSENIGLRAVTAGMGHG